MASALPQASDCCSPCSNTVTVTITTNTVGAVGVFETMADLRAFTDTDDAVFAIVLGNEERGDGGGGQFYWDESSVEEDNGISVIRPDNFDGDGVWKQVI